MEIGELGAWEIKLCVTQFNDATKRVLGGAGCGWIGAGGGCR